ncbi:FAD-dependent oxidoreductase [Pusillimonas sp. ANT_WB101]|uniref:FAD-dependent oxidoreductase n=1 Tax=Pusillimonas sp. ANT_WB101 TaxID=2597356 RepID=UPI0011EDEE96|nr:FAD-dependent oxidoreductase [Pusillimonas sp. ANT_WB101]KAA0911274.1 FAD-dependent oxidoreductase [Pusillimonas sp. ANT_WB101]
MKQAEHTVGKKLSEIEGQVFDVVVVGGGASGASTSQNLAAKGYKVLLVDKSDFASGTSSRSSRLLYCGLAHLSPDHPMWQFILGPFDLMRRVHMARLAMKCRTQMVKTIPERLIAHQFFFPVHKDGDFPGWKVDLGFRLLELIGFSKVRLNYQRLGIKKAAEKYGMVKYLAQNKSLQSVGVYTEYQYNWAERICVDAILDAEQLGAVICNYTEVTALSSQADGSWHVSLVDKSGSGQHAQVTGRVLINTAGPWVDRVIAKADAPTGKKHLIGIKGVNILVKLPPECEGQGLETISSIGQPFYCMPWGTHHFFGPTDTVFEGDPDDARVLPEEIEYILKEANFLFPSLKLTEKDIVHSWCGIRPRTAATGEKDIIKLLSIHDLDTEGMPNAMALTGTPIMNHRYAGEKIAERVGQMIKPTLNENTLSHAARLFPEDASSEPVDPDFPHVSIADLRHAARYEHVQTLSDLMFRRVGLGWGPKMGLNVAQRAADAVADILGWDAQEVDRQVAAYEYFVRDNFNPSYTGKDIGS